MAGIMWTFLPCSFKVNNCYKILHVKERDAHIYFLLRHLLFHIGTLNGKFLVPTICHRWRRKLLVVLVFGALGNHSLSSMFCLVKRESIGQIT